MSDCIALLDRTTRTDLVLAVRIIDWVPNR